MRYNRSGAPQVGFLYADAPVPVQSEPPRRYLGDSPIATLRSLTPGSETAETLRYMRDLCRASLRAGAQTVRNQALEIVAPVAARDWYGEVCALQAWVRDRIRYVMDPDDLELVQTPERTLSVRQGDCDDKATLLAALLLAVGHPAQFIAVGFNGESFSHVLVRTKIAEDWVCLETILPDVPVGWCPPGVTSQYILKV